MFFIVGPLRTGSSLLSRCLDDHPDVLCFCESEINRTLWNPYSVVLHMARMQHHGFTTLEFAQLLNRKRQQDIDDTMRWYDEASAIAKTRWEKPEATLIGDKSPDFFTAPRLVQVLQRECRLLYTIRDPRAIFRSIVRAPNSPPQDMHTRWENLKKNFKAWEDRLTQENILVVRYENLVMNPEKTMSEVYRHLGIAYSDRFLQDFQRLFPSRFLWKTAIDLKTGVRNDFEPARIDAWRTDLTKEELDYVRSDQEARKIMDHFGYEWS